ncbi:MAG: bifunctional [glutamine synthetase] adenylyltransferase/[glutamine synthetase]-adenylyl-L-tyrosine phosphorylase [Pseudomonadota bacterium]
MTPLAARITAVPRPADPQRGAASLARLGGTFATGPARDLVLGTAGSSPFLARLMSRHADWLTEAAEQAPETALDALIEEPREAAVCPRALAPALRQMRGRAALLIALADLGGVWPLEAVTGALSRLARAALAIALPPLIAAEQTRGTLPALDGMGGYTVIGMGKLGAEELNYSSDIDLICLFDQDRAPQDAEAEIRQGFVRVTRKLVAALSEQTGDGYVFRTDLRLRPNPSTTPVCLSMAAAEGYYEAEGRTWERAAHIKAAPVGGDLEAGEAYLARLSPFVWRRSLDFYALEEVQGLLDKIRAGAGEFATPSVETLPGTDIKRCPGGIREIEFFAQTRQLILGGRDPSLRARGTVEALDALVAAGHLPQDAAAVLSEAYRAHRVLEHRLQMVEDAQTHTIPTGAEARERVAALSGYPDADTHAAEIAARVATVYEAVEAITPTPHRRRGPAAVDAPLPEEEALAAQGFARAKDAAATLARWRSGQITATRSERARALYRRIEGRILEGLAGAADPDEALAHFGRFLDSLPAGVQVFSLLAANPHFLDLVAEVMSASPRLAHYLGRNPGALDALIDRDFFAPLPSAPAQIAGLQASCQGISDLERGLDAVRAWAREQSFRAGVQVMRALTDEREAGAGFSAIADACLTVLLPQVVEDLAARHGPPPGRGMAVIALGKLGTREMTAGSDLDLLTIYDAGDAESSEGPRPLAPSAYYPRLMKAFVAALTAPTAEGRLYEVDMRLRPSGRAGPVAVSLESFRRYHAGEAEVWEHLALSRARVVTACGPGAAGLSAEVRAAIDGALARRRGAPGTLVEALAMRQRLIEAHEADRRRPWALKHTAGGMMEIEFLAQTGALYTGAGIGLRGPEMLDALALDGWLTHAEAGRLAKVLSLLHRLQQVERAALDRESKPEDFGPGLRSALARAAGAPDFDTLSTRLATHTAEAAEIATARFAAIAPAEGA